MATVKLNTCAVNLLAGGMSFQELLSDVVMDIYSGTMPTYANDADTSLGGVKLCRVTLASGAVATTDRSTPRSYEINIGSHGSGETFIYDVTVGAAALVTYSYTNTPDLTAAQIATAVALLLHRIQGLHAIAAAAADADVVVKGIPGFALTIAKNAGATGTTTVTAIDAAARVNTLQFGRPTAGVISKTADVWSGVNLATGVAAWGRFVWPDDTGALVTLTQPRVQFDINTSGAVYNIGNTTLTSGATHTVQDFSLTIPMAPAT